jgi:hypothetical protein
MAPHYDLARQSMQGMQTASITLQKRSQLRTYGVGFANMFASHDHMFNKEQQIIEHLESTSNELPKIKIRHSNVKAKTMYRSVENNELKARH